MNGKSALIKFKFVLYIKVIKYTLHKIRDRGGMTRNEVSLSILVSCVNYNVTLGIKSEIKLIKSYLICIQVLYFIPGYVTQCCTLTCRVICTFFCKQKYRLMPRTSHLWRDIPTKYPQPLTKTLTYKNLRLTLIVHYLFQSVKLLIF